MRLPFLFAVALLAAGIPRAYAIDHANLDEGRPLRLEDAYPVATGEWTVEAGAGFTLQRRGPDRGFFPVEVLHGAFPNFQLGLGSTLSTDPHEVDEPTKSGDLQLSALYNFNQETLSLPAFGLKLTVNFPTGVDSSGIDLEVKGIVTKSFGRLSLHLNAAYEFLTSDTDTRRVTVSSHGAPSITSDERDGRYKLAAGASYPVGAPQYTRTTVLGDLFAEQGSRRGEASVVGVEVGFRHQLTYRVVVDAGAGTELTGPAERARFFVTAGVSIGF
ncbi:MAG TPA: transporter [Methylomirabilota bacterium]|nr:transporter [Methylomirabilota bacterium]